MSFMPPYLSLQPRDQLTRSEPEPERRLGFGFNFNPWNKRFLKNDRKELNVSFLCLLRTIKAPFHIIFSTLSTLYTLKVMWTNDWESTPALKSQFCNNNSTFTWHYEALRNINTLVINEERLLLQISALSPPFKLYKSNKFVFIWHNNPNHLASVGFTILCPHTFDSSGEKLYKYKYVLWVNDMFIVALCRQSLCLSSSLLWTCCRHTLAYSSCKQSSFSPPRFYFCSAWPEGDASSVNHSIHLLICFVESELVLLDKCCLVGKDIGSCGVPQGTHPGHV